MKKLILISTFLFCTINLLISQTTFEKSYKLLSKQEAAQSVIEDGNGGYVIATGGKFNSPDTTRDFGLAKLNAYGDTLWYTVYSMKYHPLVRAVRKTMNAYYVLGQADDTSEIQNYMFWINKFDLQGNPVWSKYYSINSIRPNDFGLNFEVLNNGNLFCTNGFSNYFLIDSIGNVISIKSYANYRRGIDQFSKQNLKNKDSIYYSACIYSTVFPFINYNTKILKLTKNTDTIGSIAINLDSAWGACQIIKFTNNGFLILGIVPSVIVQNDDGYILSFIDSLGNRLWRKRINGINYLDSYLTSNAVLQNGNIVISGFPRAGGMNASPQGKCFLYCFSGNGDSLWYKEFRTDTLHKSEFYDVIATSDSSLLACGQIMYSGGNRESYIVKLDSNGNLFNPLKIVERKREAYLNLYPNPSSNFTSIHYMGFEKNVSITISNIHGQIVFSQLLSSNDERLMINTNLFNSGFYLCSINTNGRVITTKKMEIIN